MLQNVITLLLIYMYHAAMVVSVLSMCPFWSLYKGHSTTTIHIVLGITVHLEII